MTIDKSTINKLHDAAKEIYPNAYAPYSEFPVAAAILCEDGRIFTGVNLENASFGLTRCAEQIAIGNAITNGCRNIVAALVITKDGDSWPCGACRQILAEFNMEMDVFTADISSVNARKVLKELLPFDFSSKDLEKSNKT